MVKVTLCAETKHANPKDINAVKNSFFMVKKIYITCKINKKNNLFSKKMKKVTKIRPFVTFCGKIDNYNVK